MKNKFDFEKQFQLTPRISMKNIFIPIALYALTNELSSDVTC